MIRWVLTIGGPPSASSDDHNGSLFFVRLGRAPPAAPSPSQDPGCRERRWQPWMRISTASPRRREGGPPSLPPPRLCAPASADLFSIRSERQLMERRSIIYLPLWFVELGIDDPVPGPDSVLEEPRPALEHRDCAEIPGRDPGAQTRRAAAVGRAFLGRRHAGRGVGVVQEFSTKASDGGCGRAARWPAAASSAWRSTPRSSATCRSCRNQRKTSRKQKPTMAASAATSSVIGAAAHGRTRRMPPLPIRTRAYCARAKARKRNSVTWATH